MPNIPTIGVFVPNGYLNAGSFAGPSGQQDAYGNNYPSGLTPGKVIELAPGEARSLALPNTSLYDGAYQCVLLDSGATASLATQGYAAYIRTDSGASQTAFPETSYENGSVTTADQAVALGVPLTSLFAGIFINPATVNGVSNAPTPGQYCFIFVGAGRAAVNYTGSSTAGQQVVPSGASNGQFTPQSATATVFPAGVALNNTTGAASQGVALWQNLFYRISNQGV